LRNCALFGVKILQQHSREANSSGAFYTYMRVSVSSFFPKLTGPSFCKSCLWSRFFQQYTIISLLFCFSSSIPNVIRKFALVLGMLVTQTFYLRWNLHTSSFFRVCDTEKVSLVGSFTWPNKLHNTKRSELLAKQELTRFKYTHLKEEHTFEHKAEERALGQKHRRGKSSGTKTHRQGKSSGTRP